MIKNASIARTAVALLSICLLFGSAAGQELPATTSGYAVGSPDVLAIGVWRQPELTGKFVVEPDGFVDFPLLGRVKVGGLTAKAIEEAITRLLADGFVKKPLVTVTVDAYRSQQVFVIGDARAQGAIPLSGDLTVLEALARAGALADPTAGTVVVMRRQGSPQEPLGPALPGTPEAIELQRLEIADLRAGRVASNLSLRHGDTIFVMQVEMVFVFGQVYNPGSYPFTPGMTVDQAIKLAGGVVELGAYNRVSVRRVVNGKVEEIGVKPSDSVQPGDSITVPRRRI